MPNFRTALCPLIIFILKIYTFCVYEGFVGLVGAAGVSIQTLAPRTWAALPHPKRRVACGTVCPGRPLSASRSYPACNLRRYTAELPTRQELACSPTADWPSGRATTRGRPAGRLRLLLLPVSAAAAGAGPSGAAPLEAARGLVKDSDLVEEEMVLVPGSRPASMNRAPRSSVM